MKQTGRWEGFALNYSPASKILSWIFRLYISIERQMNRYNLNLLPAKEGSDGSLDLS